MIKLLAFIFWTSLWTISSFAQKDYLFESLEEALSVHPDSVYQLSLSHNKLEKVPTEVLNFKNLHYLDLSRNKLSELPDEMYFPHLEIINLSRNKFEIFPEELCRHTTLKQLLIGRNELAIIPDCIGELENLKILDLWLNVLTDLPDSLMKLQKLELLDLRGMNFSDKFQGSWHNRLPNAKIEFDRSCDCAY